eukprot:CAMPEP_0181428284 /NCGR_PEP_ID=MMETSP1110-20121109/16600_1 /TAXON_ID=174948 /ORGANISM="Symbiodinium sp., Strain CCMP421" /LENGTH=169 /DNA_ID=CAMNT_0023551507 /DNA_START=56 /DNA_END=565 /DNA_ORIENTATION=-
MECGRSMMGYVAPPPGLEQVAPPSKPRTDGNQDAQLMAKALTDLFGRLPSADVARMTEILTGLASGGGKLSTSDHTMLTQAIRQLEVEVATSVQKLSRPAPCQPMPDMFQSLSTTPSVSPQGNSPCDSSEEEGFQGVASRPVCRPPARQRRAMPPRKAQGLNTTAHFSL